MQWVQDLIAPLGKQSMQGVAPPPLMAGDGQAEKQVQQMADAVERLRALSQQLGEVRVRHLMGSSVEWRIQETEIQVSPFPNNLV